MLNNIQTKELAEFLGVTDGFISQIKTGYRKLPIKHCKRVSKRFGIPLSNLRPDIFDDEKIDSAA